MGFIVENESRKPTVCRFAATLLTAHGDVKAALPLFFYVIDFSLALVLC